MNVPTEELLGLANVLGVTGNTKTSAVVRLATERLTGEREYFLEYFDTDEEKWVFAGWHETFTSAQDERSHRRAVAPTARYRIVEMLRRVMP